MSVMRVTMEDLGKPVAAEIMSYFCTTGMVANVEITRLSSRGRKRAC